MYTTFTQGSSDFLPVALRYRSVFLESLQEFYINMYNPRRKDLSLCSDIIRAASQFRTLKSPIRARNLQLRLYVLTWINF